MIWASCERGPTQGSDFEKSLCPIWWALLDEGFKVSSMEICWQAQQHELGTSFLFMLERKPKPMLDQYQKIKINKKMVPLCVFIKIFHVFDTSRVFFFWLKNSSRLCTIQKPSYLGKITLVSIQF